MSDRLPLTRDTLSAFTLEESLGINVNSLVDAFKHADRDPLYSLQLLVEVRHAADTLEGYIMRKAADSVPSWQRRRSGWARWSSLAAALGVSRQALQQRYPDL